MNRDSAVEQLCDVYRQSAQIGLVLGAGVSKDSGVPLYRDLARRLFDLAREERKLRGVPAEIAPDADPDQILQYLRDHLDKQETLALLVKEVLYCHVVPGSHKMVDKLTYEANATLSAVITFCAAKSSTRWEANPKIGGILTTNYDNLVEASFGSKYGKKLLHPVARETSRETMPGKRIIPVYHMHGYVSYVPDTDAPNQVKASELVIAEEDYYRTFYNLLGFSNVVAMSFLRQFPCLFIGCSMQDRNIRRILYHQRRERISASTFHRHFAILPPCPAQDFDDALLESLGVTSIRLEDAHDIGKQIEPILKRVYASVEGVTEADWSAAQRGNWSRKRRN